MNHIVDHIDIRIRGKPIPGEISTELSVDGVGGSMGAIASWSSIDILPHRRLYRNSLYFRVDQK